MWSMEIREVLQSEISIFYELMGEVEYSLYNMGNKKHLEWLEKRIDRLYYSGAKFFGGFDEVGSPVGIITILIDEAPEGINDGFNSCEVIEMGVIKGIRNKGYGSQLLKHAEKYAKGKSVYCMYMHTYAGDYDVIAFYGKNGFVPVGMLPDVYGPKNEGMIYLRKVITR
jgi:GNAT superfamily N-acetyltransferase